MGSSTDFRTYRFKQSPETRKRKLTREIVEKLFDKDQQDSAYDHGHSYSGAIGVMPKGIEWINQIFKTEDEAYEWIENHHEKWNKAMGAQFKKGKLGERNELRADLDEVNHEILILQIRIQEIKTHGVPIQK